MPAPDKTADQTARRLAETTDALAAAADALADLLYAARFVCPAVIVKRATDQLNAARDRVETNRKDYAGAPPEAAEDRPLVHGTPE